MAASSTTPMDVVNEGSAADASPSTATAAELDVILFYKYRSIDPELEVPKLNAATAGRLTGRVLVSEEGLNGTLAGAPADVAELVELLVADPLLRFEASDFKCSKASAAEPPFPDLVIKRVAELISTGGVFSSIPISDTGEGYLTPEEFRAALEARDRNAAFGGDGDGGSGGGGGGGGANDVVLLDVRNQREAAIGHFAGALVPPTRTFAEYPKWLEENKSMLEGKQVLWPPSPRPRPPSPLWRASGAHLTLPTTSHPRSSCTAPAASDARRRRLLSARPREPRPCTT